MSKNKTKKDQETKKELKDCSKRELIKLVRDQHQHIKMLQSDNEYLKGIYKANNLLVKGAMLELGVNILRVKHETTEKAKNDYVLHWEREEKTKDKLFQLEDRESWEKRKAANGTDQNNNTKSTPVN